jgi:hypothetical protein
VCVSQTPPPQRAALTDAGYLLPASVSHVFLNAAGAHAQLQDVLPLRQVPARCHGRFFIGQPGSGVRGPVVDVAPTASAPANLHDSLCEHRLERGPALVPVW